MRLDGATAIDRLQQSQATLDLQASA